MQSALRISPKQYLPHLLIAEAYLGEHRFQSALDEAQQALRWGKGDATFAEYIAGCALAALGRPEQALSTLQQFLKHAPDSSSKADARHMLVRMQHLEKQPE